jgi:TfoX/Sxy family transcriptional regulator of competence genes
MVDCSILISMATQKETVEGIIRSLGDRGTFSTRAMFGEYAFYAQGKVVGLICNDRLYIKILPASQVLAETCEQGSPYPGAKPSYIIEDAVLARADFPSLLTAIADSLPAKK